MKAVVLLAALALASCSAPGSTLTALPTGASSSFKTPSDILGAPPLLRTTVSLFDAPLTGLSGISVNMGIEAVQLVTPNGTAVPFVTNAQPDVVNLLDLQTHSEDFTGSAAAGTYSAVRLLIDPSTTNVKFDGFTIPILWGTAAQPVTTSVITVDFPGTFIIGSGAGVPPSITLDFNLLRSAKFANGAIYLQPSVSAASSAAQVMGNVHNRAGKPVVNASIIVVDAFGRVVNNTVTDANGTFTLRALPAGSYTLRVQNSYVTPLGDTITASNADKNGASSIPLVLAPNANVSLNSIRD